VSYCNFLFASRKVLTLTTSVNNTDIVLSLFCWLAHISWWRCCKGCVWTLVDKWNKNIFEECERCRLFLMWEKLKRWWIDTLEVETLTAGCYKLITISSSRTTNLSWIKDSVCKKEDTCDLGFHWWHGLMPVFWCKVLFCVVTCLNVDLSTALRTLISYKGTCLKIHIHTMDKKFLHTKLLPCKKLEFCSSTKTPTRITLHFPKYKVLVWEAFLLYNFNFGFSPKKFPLNAFQRLYNHYPSHDGQSAP